MTGAFRWHHNTSQAICDSTKHTPHFHPLSCCIVIPYIFSYSFLRSPHFFASTFSHVPRFLTLKSDSLVPIISVNKISLKLLWGPLLVLWDLMPSSASRSGSLPICSSLCNVQRYPMPDFKLLNSKF